MFPTSRTLVRDFVTEPVKVLTPFTANRTDSETYCETQHDHIVKSGYNLLSLDF